MADDTRLQVLIEANTKAFENALKRLETTTNESFRRQGKSVESLNRQLETIRGTVEKVARVFGLAFGARELVEFVRRNIEAGAAVAELADKLGITAEATQELSYAAGQAGVQADALVAAFKGMSKVVVDAERGSKAAKDQLAELGLTLADIKGNSPDKTFELISDRISKMRDPLTRTNELVKFFGKSGADLAPLVAKGAAGIDELRKRAREMGIVLSGETIARAKEAADKIKDIGDAGQVAGIKIAAQFTPAIDAIRDLVTSPTFQKGLEDTAGWIGQIIKFFADNPDLLKTLAAAAVGYKLFGPAGAAVAAIGPQLIPGPAGPSQETVVVNGERITLDELRKRYPNGGNAARAVGIGSSPFDYGFDSGSMPGLSAAAAKRAAADSSGGGGKIVDLAAKAAAEAVQKKVDDLTRSLGVLYTNLNKTRREQEIANEVEKIGAGVTKEQADKIAELTGRLFDAKEAQKALNDATALFAGLGYDAIYGLITGAKSLNDVLKDTVARLADAALQAALLGQGPLAGLLGTAPTGSGSVGGILGAILGSIFHRAGGGPVTGGMPYMVGERGPELFVPNVGGAIVPRGGVGGGSSNLHVSVDVRGARGNKEIEQMVAQGVHTGLLVYDKTKSRQAELAA